MLRSVTTDADLAKVDAIADKYVAELSVASQAIQLLMVTRGREAGFDRLRDYLHQCDQFIPYFADNDCDRSFAVTMVRSDAGPRVDVLWNSRYSSQFTLHLQAHGQERRMFLTLAPLGHALREWVEDEYLFVAEQVIAEFGTEF